MLKTGHHTYVLEVSEMKRLLTQFLATIFSLLAIAGISFGSERTPQQFEHQPFIKRNKQNDGGLLYLQHASEIYCEPTILFLMIIHNTQPVP
jgi:hypothetical protein